MRYSKHAEKRLAERSISVRDVESAIRSPLELMPVRYGRYAVCARLPSGKVLVVIYEQEEEDFIVVTALKTNEEGAKRFGFTRV